MFCFLQVQLQQKIKQESEQFRLWKVTREKEVLQVNAQGKIFRNLFNNNLNITLFFHSMVI